MEERIIDAVHENDLEIFLENLGLLKEIKEGKIKCEFCGKIISLENFYCVYPYKNDIKVCCENPSCRLNVKKLFQKEDEGD